MPTIKPSASLRNSYNEISELCHKSNEPVFITKNGEGDLAIMSIQTYEALVGKYELTKLINEGLDDINNKRVLPAKDALESIKQEIKGL